MKITPIFKYDEYNFGFGVVFNRQNISKLFNRDYRSVEYIFGIIFLWFQFGVEIEVRGIRNG